MDRGSALRRLENGISYLIRAKGASVRRLNETQDQRPRAYRSGQEKDFCLAKGGGLPLPGMPLGNTAQSGHHFFD